MRAERPNAAETTSACSASVAGRRVLSGWGALLLVASTAISGCRGGGRTYSSLFDTSASDRRVRELDAFDLPAVVASPAASKAGAAPARDVPELPTVATRKAPAPAAESLRVAVPDVRAAVLRNDLELGVQMLAPEIAMTTVSEEEARFEATFVASLTTESTDTTFMFGGPLTTSVTTLSPGIRVPLRTGGSVNVALPWKKTIGHTPALDRQESEADLQFSISQPLLRGAGVYINEAPIEVARLLGRREDAGVKLAAIRLLANAERLYWDLWAATREVEIRHEQYLQALSQVEDSRKLADKGAIAGIDVLRAEAGASARMDAIVVAETSRRLVQRSLKRTMNRPDMPVDGPTTLTPATDPRPQDYRLDADATMHLGLKHRMEMLRNEIELAVASVNEDVARNGTLPSFAFDFSYSFRGADTSYSSTVRSLFANDFDDWRAGLTLEVPLGNQAARARLCRAVLERARSLATREQLEAAIRNEVLDAIDQLSQSWQRILAAREETIRNAKAFEGERRQFAAGVRTSTDVIIAAGFLADARSHEAQALAEWQRSLVEVAFATGTVLGMGHVRWDEGPTRRSVATRPRPVPLAPPAPPAAAAAAAPPAATGSGSASVAAGSAPTGDALGTPAAASAAPASPPTPSPPAATAPTPAVPATDAPPPPPPPNNGERR